MKKQYKEVIYTCDYCNFSSNDPKVVGQHEYNCEHKPEDKLQIKEKERREDKSKIYESVTPQELNKNIKQYIEKYKPVLYTSFNELKISYNSYDYTFKLSSKNYGDTRVLDSLGISQSLADYPNLHKLCREFYDIKKGSAVKEYDSKFQDLLKTELNKFEETNEDYIDLTEEIAEIRDEISVLREKMKPLEDKLLKAKITQDNLWSTEKQRIKDENNYIDYYKRSKEILTILTGKSY